MGKRQALRAGIYDNICYSNKSHRMIGADFQDSMDTRFARRKQISDKSLRDMAAEFLAHDNAALDAAVSLGKIEEIDNA